MTNRIDVHHHFFAQEYRDAMGANALRPEIRDWTVQRTKEEMDKNGVATAMLSLSPPGIHRGTREQTKALARAINEHAAKMRAQDPVRFGHFASIPMPNVDDAIAEIAYAMDTLKSDGVQLMTSYGNRWPGHPDFDPVFAELNRRKAVVFTHPVAAPCCSGLIPEVGDSEIAFGTDTSYAIASMIFTGASQRFADLSMIFSHGGGTVPYLIRRFVTDAKNQPKLA